MDLAVDEQGLWVLWGNSDDNLRLWASKIDNDVIVQSYRVSTGKRKITCKTSIASHVSGASRP